MENCEISLLKIVRYEKGVWPALLLTVNRFGYGQGSIIFTFLSIERGGVINLVAHLDGTLGGS